MITNRLFQSEEPPEECDHEARLDECSEKYSALLDAARDTGATYLVAVLEEDGLAAWENATEGDGDIERLKALYLLLSVYVADQISDQEGEDAVAAFFARLVAGVIDD